MSFLAPVRDEDGRYPALKRLSREELLAKLDLRLRTQAKTEESLALTDAAIRRVQDELQYRLDNPETV